MTRAHKRQIFNRMVEYQLDRVFGALADPTRRALLGHLAQGERTVSDLARPWRVSLNAISKHVKVLEGAGLVRRRVDGRIHHLSLRHDVLHDATEWLRYHQQFWSRSLDALAELAATTAPPAQGRKHARRTAGRRRRG